MSGTPVERRVVLLAGNEDNPGFAENVARIRRKKKLTQRQVSSRSGIHDTEISRIERGLRDPRLSTILSIADALDVRPGSLLKPISGERVSGSR
jgi:transcriptional regulator with XRE-family HTH domain